MKDKDSDLEKATPENVLTDVPKQSKIFSKKCIILSIIGVIIVTVATVLLVIYLPTSQPTETKDNTKQENFVKVDLQFVDASGISATENSNRGRRLNNANTAGNVYGGAASIENIDSFKVAVRSISLCAGPYTNGWSPDCVDIVGGYLLDDFGNELLDEFGNMVISYEDDVYTGTINDDNTLPELTQETFNDFVEWIPNASWVDLMDERPGDNLRMTGKLKPATSYTWGIVEWFRVIKVRASVPLYDINGIPANRSVHTKPSIVSGPRYYEDIGYFPNVVEEDMTLGNAEEITFFPSDNSPYQRFRLGTPVMTPNISSSNGTNTSITMRLELSYNLDKSTIVAFQGTENIDGISQSNVMSFDANNTQMEIRFPKVLPILYDSRKQKVFRATYNIEIDSNLPGAQEKFSFKPNTPWQMHLDTFFVVDSSQESLKETDKMFSAYFTLQNYYEVEDYLGDLYDYGQIDRIYYISDYSPHPVLANKKGFHSVLEDFVPKYNVGDSGLLTVYHVSGGNFASHCECDFEKPLLTFLRNNDLGDEYISYVKDSFVESCLYYGESTVYEEQKKVCRPNEDDTCCGKNVATVPLPPHDLDYWAYNDNHSLNSHYLWGEYDLTCPFVEQFNLCDTCDYSDCQNGDGIMCSRVNFGSAGGGCSPTKDSEDWDYRNKQTYTLIEISSV